MKNEPGKNNILRLFGLVCLIVFFPLHLLAQTMSTGEMTEYFSGVTGIPRDEFRAVDEGKLVSKLLSATDKSEVSVFGIVRLDATLAESRAGFKKTMIGQKQSNVSQSGEFSNPPRVEDLAGLTLSDREIEDLRACRIANCKFKLSAPMIKRFETEIDWDSAGYKKEVIKLYRRMLVGYVGDYINRGDQALIEYSDRRYPTAVLDELQDQYKQLFWIDESAPEFFSYLIGNSKSIPGVKNTFNWSKVKIGLKSVIIITHVIDYDAQDDTDRQILIVSKQIYSNHYFKSSLGFTALVEKSRDSDTKNTYVIYLNRSRSDSLDGPLGKFVRKIVESEAVGKLETLLKSVKGYAEAEASTDTAPRQVEVPGVMSSSGYNLILGLSVLGLLIYLTIFILRKRNR